MISFIRKFKTEFIVGGIAVGIAGLAGLWHFHYRPLQDKRDALELFKRGVDEYNRQRHEAAVELFTQSLRKNSKYWKTYNNRANAYLKLGRSADALRDADESLKLMPSANGRLIQGRALMGLERYDEAVTAFQQCLGASDVRDQHKRWAQHFIDKCRGVTVGGGGSLSREGEPASSLLMSAATPDPTRTQGLAGSVGRLPQPQLAMSPGVLSPAPAPEAKQGRSAVSTPNASVQDLSASTKDLEGSGSLSVDDSRVVVTRSQIMNNSVTQSAVLVQHDDAPRGGQSQTLNQQSPALSPPR